MAGWTDINASDQAFSQEETIVRRLAVLLQFDYTRSEAAPHLFNEDDALRSPSNHSRPLTLKYAYRTLPYALGFPTWNGELVVVCITNMSGKIFWPYVAEAFGMASDAMPEPQNDEVIIPLSDLAKLSERVPHVSKLRLLYTRQSWDAFEEPPPILRRNTTISRHDRHLAHVYDSQGISRTVSTLLRTAVETMPISSDEHQPRQREWLKLFREGFLQLRHWARCSGILSDRMDMLTDEILLHKYIDTLQQLHPLEIASLSRTSIMTSVLTSSSFLHPQKTPIAYGSQMVIVPESGFALKTVTSESFRAFMNANDVIDSGRMPPDRWAEAARKAFILQHECFIKVDARCWVPKMKHDFTEALPSILLQLQNHIRMGKRKVLATIWPYSVARLVDRESEDVFILGAYTRGEEPVKKEDVDWLCRQYMDKLNYDRDKAAIDCSVISPDEAAELLPHSAAAQESMMADIQKAEATEALGTTSTSHQRFRTAASAMARLRWDPQHASFDYEVGYVDRFEPDLMWKALDKWEKATEEEEFIPEHRIQQIRRRAGRTVIWDRRRKLDATG